MLNTDENIIKCKFDQYNKEESAICEVIPITSLSLRFGTEELVYAKDDLGGCE